MWHVSFCRAATPASLPAAAVHRRSLPAKSIYAHTGVTQKTSGRATASYQIELADGGDLKLSALDVEDEDAVRATAALVEFRLPYRSPPISYRQCSGHVRQYCGRLWFLIVLISSSGR